MAGIIALVVVTAIVVIALERHERRTRATSRRFVAGRDHRASELDYGAALGDELQRHLDVRPIAGRALSWSTSRSGQHVEIELHPGLKVLDVTWSRGAALDARPTRWRTSDGHLQLVDDPGDRRLTTLGIELLGGDEPLLHELELAPPRIAASLRIQPASRPTPADLADRIVRLMGRLERVHRRILDLGPPPPAPDRDAPGGPFL